MVDILIEDAKRMIKRVYPEFHSTYIGKSKSGDYLVFAIDFPDGFFYFCVDDRSVSSAYIDKDDALNQ